MEPGTPFSQKLRQSRRAARLSQLALSTRSGVSQRHLSFLESGRASPGRGVVLQLGRALNLSLAAQCELMEAAGYSATGTPPVAFDSAAMSAIREAAERMLRQHEPYPGLLMDRAYNLVQANDAFGRLLSRIDNSNTIWLRTAGRGKPNLLKLSLHTEGLRPFVPDFRGYASAILIRAERAAVDFPALRAVLGELREDPLLDEIFRSPSALDTAQTGPAWMERYLLDGQQLQLFSVQSSIGIPMDVMAESVLLECFFPGDVSSARFLAQL